VNVLHYRSMSINTLDEKIIVWLRRWSQPAGRVAIFIIYFYFGFLKLIGESPATPLAQAFVNKTLGASHFHEAYMALAVFECLIGVLFLFPRLTRVVVPLLLLHMVIVCLPLFVVPYLAFSKPFVPTLEGQYIIKNVAIIALALGVAAQTPPLSKSATGKR
jgi:uncharacterized membrane protein YkgB